tara:strand:+ start:278 stop:1459 length:1182 start_codon:yes stop_codon:yes gene_type:complete
MSEIRVNSIKGVGASTAAITVNNSDGTCTANITNNLSNRNLIINGAMQVAQRGTSSTTATAGYHTVDRFRYAIGGHDEVATHAQVDVASGTSPYQSGFRKAYKITNGNQTSGAGSSDYIQIDYYVEAQDIANSGWDVTNSSSNLTFSFWIKSSVSQFFTFAIRCKDGTEQVINFKTPVLSADTWTKVTKTIPGNSNLTVHNNNGRGFQIMFFPFIGTDYTTVGLAEDTWSAWASAKHAVPNTSTWWTTNDATWEITGVQLEVSDHATDFEHRSYGQELALCQRYCFVSEKYATASSYSALGIHYSGYQTSTDNWMWVSIPFPVTMRAAPTVDTSDAAGNTGNKHTIYTSTGGTVTNNVANYHTQSFKDHFTISNYSQQKYGMKVVGVKAEAEL